MEYQFVNDYDLYGVSCQNALHCLAWVECLDCNFCFKHNGSLDYFSLCFVITVSSLTCFGKACHSDGVNFLPYKYIFLNAILGLNYILIKRWLLNLFDGKMWRHEIISLFNHEVYLGYSPLLYKLEGFWTLQSCFELHGTSWWCCKFICWCEIEAWYIGTWTCSGAFIELVVAFLLA